MGLPKIDIVTFTTELPSNKQKIIYRPFLVKEEKILLMATKSDSQDDQLNAIKQIINNCRFIIFYSFSCDICFLKFFQIYITLIFFMLSRRGARPERFFEAKPTWALDKNICCIFFENHVLMCTEHATYVFNAACMHSL